MIRAVDCPDATTRFFRLIPMLVLSQRPMI